MIRNAIKNDIPEIIKLMKSVDGFWNPMWTPDTIDHSLVSSNGLCFVYEEKDILGFICAHDLGFRAYLSELVVSPVCQGTGIGKTLVQKVENELFIRGCKILIADVWKSSEQFYRSLGWTNPDVILLRKKLS